MTLPPGLRRSLALAILFAVSALPARAATAAPWRETDSDLPADPALQRGVLENGVRYSVLRHAYPTNRVSVRLLVASGSRDERNDERGIAHFVEHMAFRGTKSFPKGAVSVELEKLGIGFGPDSSAFTSYDNTIYVLELPDNKPETLGFALKLFREFAEGITFEPEAIDLERPIILNEKAIRNNSDYREVGNNQAFLWPTAREVYRSPIGLAETINRFRREQLVAFYDAWYRPERMAVIVTGDIEPAATLELVRRNFADLRGRGEPPPAPTGLVPERAGDQSLQVYREQTISGVGIIFEHPYESAPKPDTRSGRKLLLDLALATTMFQSRVRRESQGPDAVFSSPVVSIDGPVQGWGLISFSGSTRIDGWRATLLSMEQKLRQAREHGFTPGELKQAKAAFAAAYEEGVRTADTRHAASLAGALVDNLLHGTPLSTPATVRDEMQPLLAAASLDDCNAAFRDVWEDVSPKLFVVGNTAFEVPNPEIQLAWSESRATAVAPPAEVTETVFAYNDFGPAGRLDRHQSAPDLGIELGEFGNGVRINFKPTTFDRETILLTVRAGSGRQSMPAIGLNVLANAAFLGGGLGRHPWPELSTLISGRNLSLSFAVDDDALVFAARTSRQDLEFCLRLIAAYFSDPAYRVSSLGDASVAISTVYGQIRNSPGGEIGARAERILTGDGRFGMPSADEMNTRDLTQLADWVNPQLQSGPVEVAFAGDVTWDEVVAATAKTLGALPPRQPRLPVNRNFIRIAAPSGVQTFTTAPMIRQASLSVVFPAGDVYGAEQDRRCDLLAEVLQEMFRLALREELGATYTPSASFVRHPAFPGLSYFLVSADVLPADLNKLPPVISKTVQNIQKDGVPPEIFARVRQTTLRRNDDGTRTNGYWLGAVLSALQQYPEQLAEARSMRNDYAAITAREMQQLAIRYFQGPRSFSFLAVPPGVQLK